MYEEVVGHKPKTSDGRSVNGMGLSSDRIDTWMKTVLACRRVRKILKDIVQKYNATRLENW